MRFAGIKNSRIITISDIEFKSENLQVVEIPETLQNLEPQNLMLNYKFNKEFIKINNRKIEDLKIALVTNYSTKCGISTYSEDLWPFIKNKCKQGHIFAEYDNKNNTEDITYCWKRGESLQYLVKSLKEYNPDIILIQHEFGLWPNASYWLSLMNQLNDYRVIVIMHSIYHHKDKTICEAAMPEIITHLEGGYKVLKFEKQIPGKVHIIPHGCYTSLETDRLWNYYKSNHTFVQFGFGFDYKGYDIAIKAVKILKEKYNDVFFTALFSESSHNILGHQALYNRLMDMIDEYKLQENVAIIRGFQSEQTLDSYLRTNKVAVFPYKSHPEHEVWGASGAARFAMSKGIPVITSNINHFSDLDVLKADNEIELANKLDLLFNDNLLWEKQKNLQLEYVYNNTWEKIANKYIEIMEA